MTFYKKKSFYIIVVIILLIVGGVAYGQYKKANTSVQYETVKVKKGDLRRTVDATGEIQSTSDLALRFETSGALADIKVKNGQEVKKGDILASLNLSELNATVAQAQANLNKQLAGATTEELNSLLAVLNNANATYIKAQADASSTVLTAESALATAKNNLKLAEGGDSSQIVTNEYQDAVAVLQKSMSVLNDGLDKSDSILGIDNTLANDEFEAYLSIKDLNKINIAKNYYFQAKSAKNSAQTVILPLTTASSQSSIDSALLVAEDALSKMNQLLVYVSDTLDATPPVGDLSQSELATLKSGIATERSATTAQYTLVIIQKQDIVSARNSYNTYLIAYNKAVNDLTTAKAQAEASLKIYKASLAQAQANYNNKLNPPREVDVASYRAALSQSVANRNKAILVAPMDGKVAKINKKVGEYISASEIMIEMVSPHYEIEVDIPETDVAKIKQSNLVTYTLDALGDDVIFNSKVDVIESKSTKIQDVVYYRVKMSVSDTDQKKYESVIKSGLTANVSIQTADDNSFKNVLYLPLRAVLTESDGKKYVRILKNNQMTSTTVSLGSRADNGQVIINSGVSEGDEVVLSIK